MLLIVFTKIILLLLLFFFMKIIFIFSCSGMFRNVPACSGMFHVPGFIDAQNIIVAFTISSTWLSVNKTFSFFY